MDIRTRKIKHAAVWQAAGLPVTVGKQPCSPRCVYSTPDTPEARRLLDQYDRDTILDIPHRQLQLAHHALVGASKALQVGRIGGV